MKQDKLQGKIIEFNMIDQQLKQLEQKIAEIEKQTYELQLSGDALDELKGKKNSEAMIPLAGGIFVKARIEDTDKAMVHIGNRILAKKSIEGAKKMLDKQMGKLSEERKIIDSEMNALLRKMTALEESIKASQSHDHGHKCSCDDDNCGECEH